MANPEQKRGVPVILWTTVISLAVLAVILVRSLTSSPVDVRVAPVVYQDLLSQTSTNGNVEPIVEFPLHPPAPGVIKKVLVEVNQHVTPGTPLVLMDDSDAEARVATAKDILASSVLAAQDIHNGGTTEDRQRYEQDITAARLEQSNALADLRTKQNLLAHGADSASEVAQAQQRVTTDNNILANAQARSTVRYNSTDVASVQARLANARAGLVAAESALAGLQMKSTIAGTVYAISKFQYDFVRPEDDLMDIADLNKLQVRAYFDEPDIGKLAKGEPVKIVWDAKPNLVWHGHVERVPTTIAVYNTRNVGECLITVDDAQGDLLPNTNVVLTVTTSQQNHVLSIPREALRIENGKNFVYRIVNGKLTTTPVTVGTVVNLTDAQVVAGLAAGDSVVLGPVKSGVELNAGMAVKRVQ